MTCNVYTGLEWLMQWNSLPTSELGIEPLSHTCTHVCTRTHTKFKAFIHSIYLHCFLFACWMEHNTNVLVDIEKHTAEFESLLCCFCLLLPTAMYLTGAALSKIDQIDSINWPQRLVASICQSIKPITLLCVLQLCKIILKFLLWEFKLIICFQILQGSKWTNWF